MIDLEGITLHKLMCENDLDAYARLKSTFFSSAYTPLYREIAKFYNKTGAIPSFAELEVLSKDASIQNSIEALKSLDVPPQVSLDLAVEGLVNRFAQNYVLESLDKFLGSVTLYDVSEIKENIAKISLDLDDKLHTDESIVYADQVHIFKEPEEGDRDIIPTGISNDFDANVGGLYQEELILVGGKRGSGKSIVCANLVAAQYKAGKTAIYYTIEMSGQEIYQRLICILADVDYAKLRKKELTPSDSLALVKARADMFLDAEDLVAEYVTTGMKVSDFEKKLLASKKLKPFNQIVIVDDRELSLPVIDMSLQKFSAQFQDNLSLVVIDYINQIVLERGASDMYDWKDQIGISKSLKNFARKYKLPIVAPYQIDATGEARFAKGLLDSCDIAFILRAEETYLAFKCVKSRSSSDDFEYFQPINWDTLAIDPVSIPEPQQQEEEEEEESFHRKKKKKAPIKIPTGAYDL